MDNVHKVFQAVNEELFPDGRQRPLGQSAGGHNDPLPPLQQNNDNTEDSEFATDEGEATDNADTNEESAGGVGKVPTDCCCGGYLQSSDTGTRQFSDRYPPSSQISDKIHR